MTRHDAWPDAVRQPMATDRFVLRDVTSVDVPDLVQSEPLLFGDDRWTEATWWAELAQRPRREYAVARVGDALAGYAGIDVAGDVADIMTIAVLPHYRHAGLGRLLMDWILERSRARGATHVILEVRQDNADAVGLYESSGFVQISVRPKYYQPGDVDALIMRKAL